MSAITWIALGLVLGASGVTIVPFIIFLLMLPFAMIGYFIGRFLIIKEPAS